MRTWSSSWASSAVTSGILASRAAAMVALRTSSAPVFVYASKSSRPMQFATVPTRVASSTSRFCHSRDTP